MSFENFDNKIKEAAEQHEPPFEDRSWNKMQSKLDSELPLEKKDRRRFLLLLLAFLILGSGTWYLTDKNKTDKIIAGNTTTSISPVEKKRSEPQANPVMIEPSQNNLEKQEVPQSTSSLIGTNTNTHSTTHPLVQGKISSFDKKGSVLFNIQGGKLTEAKNTSSADSKNTENSTPVNSTDIKPEPVVSAQADKEVAKVTSIESKADTQSPEVKQEEQKPITPLVKNESKKKNTRRVSDIAISVSAGPDISLVSLHNTGKIQISYGVGLSYPISKKLSIRSGFYVARKIYSAEPGDYNPPKEFWNWYPNLKTIDANCMVYEIPLIVDFHLGKQKQWFVSSGLSSIIMKQEDYSYTYRPPYAQQDVTYSKTHKNENDHLFSMVHISGGYNYQINDRLSLRAEPYAKIPLNGIGYGKIKLNSGGVLMSLIVKPFTRSQ